MKLKRLTVKQRLSIIVPLVFVVVAFLIVSKSYFNNQEINMASRGCLEQDGIPIVTTTFLTLDYSFSCES